MKNKFFILLLMLLVFVLFLHPVDSSDFFHHITAGRDIFNNNGLPYLDTHTFTAYGRPWVAHSWASGLTYFVVYQILGIPGVNIFFCLLGLGTIASLTLFAKKYSGVSINTLLLLVLTSATLSLYWPSRPLIMGAFFVAELLLFLKLYKKYWFLVPIYFVVWGIFYGASVLLGLIVFALFLMSDKEKWSLRNLTIWIISLLAACLNGYGLKSIFYLFGPQLAMQSQEWFPVYKLINLPLTPLTNYRLATYFGELIITIACFIYIVKNHKNILKHHIFESVLTLGVLAPFISFRFINLVPVFVFPFILLSINTISKKYQSITSWVFAVFAAIILMVRFAYVPFGFGLFGTNDEKPFLNAISYMKSHKIYGDVFTSQSLGPYIYWFIPESKVFVDTRDELFLDTDVYPDLEKVINGSEPITIVLDKYKTNIVFGRPIAVYKPLLNNPKWQFVYKKEYFVAIRKSE